MQNRIGHKSKHDEVKEQRMNIVARLFRRGYTFRQIREMVMKELGLPSYSLRTVKNDVDRLLGEWRKERVTDTDVRIQLELQRISDVEREAWEAWEASKVDYDIQRARQKGVPAGAGGAGSPKVTEIEQEKKTVHTCGDAGYLDIVTKQQMERRKLLGLYAPEKKELTGKDGSPLIPTKEMTEEQISAEIERIRKSRTQ